jgi:hypothetical protein
MQLTQGQPSDSSNNHADSLNFVSMHSRLVVALGSDDSRLRTIAQTRYPDCCIVGLTTTAGFEDDTQELQIPSSISLEDIYRFDGMIQAKLRASSRLLLCAGNRVYGQIRVFLLLGCHLLISQGLGFEETVLTFRAINETFASHYSGVPAIEQYLRAVCCAKCLKWIDFEVKHGVLNNDEMTAEIHMDEYIHYIRFLRPLLSYSCFVCTRWGP